MRHTSRWPSAAGNDGADMRGRPVAEAHGPALAGIDVALGYDVAGLYAPEDFRTIIEKRLIVWRSPSPIVLMMSRQRAEP
jgi:hypothetical protein